ncbi:MAG TPA: RyR domain-containing protein [Pyrinomonadaceae bacterium]|nr:RyR domain-containing protein [Pyrinomonadaceae bacterium]
MRVSDVARICHEANKALCESQNDNSQKPWVDAEPWQIDSAVKGVEFNLKNPDAPASASHDSWLEEKRATGWKYGSVKDADKKEHPCFVPYEELPDDQKAKDHLFKAIVCSLAPFVVNKPE